MSSNTLFLLLTALFLKHFFADFPLQTLYMLLGKGRKDNWVLPLASHALVHAIMTGVIISIWNWHFAWVALIDFVIHFAIDRVKATYKLPQGQWTDTERGKHLRAFYMAFGLDQLGHALTYIFIMYLIS